MAEIQYFIDNKVNNKEITEIKDTNLITTDRHFIYYYNE
jgi:hypothetical protein